MIINYNKVVHLVIIIVTICGMKNLVQKYPSTDRSTYITAVFLGPGGVLVSALTLSSTVSARQHVCPGQEVNFTCSTEDSPTIAFASVEYIDIGSQLEFAIFNSPGEMRISPINPETVATLVENSINEDRRQIILVSVLRLIILPQFPMFTISCFHANGTGITTTLSVQGELMICLKYNLHYYKCGCHAHNFDPLLLEPIMPQNVIAKQKVERYTGNSNCTIFIAWINIARDDVSNFTIYINGTSYYVLNKTQSINQDLILTAFPVCTCAEHQVSVSAVDRCGHEGQRSPSITTTHRDLISSDTVACDFALLTNNYSGAGNHPT